MSDKWQACSSHTDVDGMNLLLGGGGREEGGERGKQGAGEGTGQESRPARADNRTLESVASLPLPAAGPGESGHVAKRSPLAAAFLSFASGLVPTGQYQAFHCHSAIYLVLGTHDYFSGWWWEGN